MITGTPSLAVRDRPRVTQCHWTKNIATPSVTRYVPDYPYLLMVLSISSREHGQCKGARLNQALAGSHCSPGEELLPCTSLVDSTINGVTPLTCNWFHLRQRLHQRPRQRSSHPATFAAVAVAHSDMRNRSLVEAPSICRSTRCPSRNIWNQHEFLFIVVPSISTKAH